MTPAAACEVTVWHSVSYDCVACAGTLASRSERLSRHCQATIRDGKITSLARSGQPSLPALEAQEACCQSR